MRIAHEPILTTGDEESFATVMAGLGAKTTLPRLASSRARTFFDALATAVKAHLVTHAEQAEPLARALDALDLPSTPVAWEWATVTLQPDLAATFGATLGAALTPLAACYYDQAMLLGADFALRAQQNTLRARVVTSALAEYDVLADVVPRLKAILVE